jgi:hypothetical protein
MDLTQHQKDMLRLGRDTGTVPAGRGGWNTAHVERLAALGLVYCSARGARSSTYRFTEAGRKAANAAHDEWKQGR